jgi:hypothetical protein
MFMPTSEIVNDVAKGDAPAFADEWSPKEQWERPVFYGGETNLRDYKLEDNPEGYRGMIRRGESPPLQITHGLSGRHLGDGHHRLANMEALGHTEVPVVESFSSRLNRRLH